MRNTVEGMCSVVASTGKLTWPWTMEGGRREVYEIDYGRCFPMSLPQS